MNHVRARALSGVRLVRADAGDPKALLEQLNKAVAELRKENDERIDALKKGLDDVVKADKVESINASIGEIQAALDDQAKIIAGLRIGGAGKPVDPDKVAHAAAFNKFARKGTEEGLRALEVKASLATDSDPDGGYLVPEEMASDVERIEAATVVMREISGQITISTGMYEKPVSLGGASSGWVGERESRPATNTPTLSLLQFPVHEIYAAPQATQRMLDDARIDVEAWLSNEIAIEFAEEEGLAFISGNGVNKPRGFLSYDTVANASWAWGKLGFVTTGVAADINDASNNGIDGLIRLVYGIKPGYRSNARFLMNRTLEGKVRVLKDANGNYLWQPPVQAGQPASLLGYPVSSDDNMPDVGANAFPVAFGDFRRGYLIVDRFGIRVLRDPYTNKPYVIFYSTKRVGGGVQNFEAIKLLKCST